VQSSIRPNFSSYFQGWTVRESLTGPKEAGPQRSIRIAHPLHALFTACSKTIPAAFRSRFSAGMSKIKFKKPALTYCASSAETRS